LTAEIARSESRSASRASRCVASFFCSCAVSASILLRSAASSSGVAARVAPAASSSPRSAARIRP
jgi:hypothetical protein